MSKFTERGRSLEEGPDIFSSERQVSIRQRLAGISQQRLGERVIEDRLTDDRNRLLMDHSTPAITQYR